MPEEEPDDGEESNEDERGEGGSDEDEVEVEVEAGRGVKRKKGHGADTPEPMLTHWRANPYCDAGVRAKTRRFNQEKGH